MLSLSRLEDILKDWSHWMRSHSHKLGYPSKSIGLVSSGNNSFEDMIESSNSNNVDIIDTAIDDLDSQEKAAIYYRYLGSKKPIAYEMKLELALNHLLELIENKIHY